MRIIKNKMGLACALNEDKETLRNLRVSDMDYRKMRKQQSRKHAQPKEGKQKLWEVVPVPWRRFHDSDTYKREKKPLIYVKEMAMNNERKTLRNRIQWMVCKMRRFQIINGELDHELYFISLLSLAHKLKDIDLYVEA